MELLSILFVLVVAPTLFASSSLLKILQVNEVELLSFFFILVVAQALFAS